ncbi:intradiol ring-cleavage dioxygenase [Microbacterium rhizophilus]|uniref:intradiol ring-cleavage dioxygenase n=1 Tax=Microbacterium rhizophilus TaxID=3138934 RepID=UPI0031EC7959
MTRRIPDPRPTSDGPSYEGRPLARPHEEVVDQGAGFDLGTLLNRRALFGLAGLGAGAALLAACAPASGTGRSASGAGGASSPSPSPTSSPGTTAEVPAAEIPDETAGPYPGDGSNGPDVLEQSGIVRSDIRSSVGSDDPVDGVPLRFTLRITDMAQADAAFAGVAVYAWHCDAQGRYSMYSQGVEDQTWLRGVQVADADGLVTFTSIMPGCYAGRWPHIHFEVYPDAGSITDSANAIATSQLALPEDVLADVYARPAYDGSAANLARISLESDNVFGEDGGALQLAAVTGNSTAGYSAALTVRVDTATEPTAGAMGGGMPPR